MLGLALEGGGAKGAFHMGAVKALIEEGYEFNGITGTSIGSLNGAIIAQGDFDAGYELWKTMDTSLFSDIQNTPEFIKKAIDNKAIINISAIIKDIVSNQGVATNKIRKMMDDIIDEDKLRKSPVDFGITMFSLSDHKPIQLYKEDIPCDKMISYLMASLNFPIFKMEPVDGKFYIDGGCYDNCPINLLAQKGYKEIIAIRTCAIGVVKKVQDPQLPVTYILPSENLGGVLNFSNSIIQTNLEMGYYDAKRVIKKLIGKKYYIEPIDNHLFFNVLNSIPDEIIFKIAKLLILPQIEPKKLLFKKIIPYVSNLLRLAQQATFQDTVIGILEYAAEERQLARYKIRSLSEFVKEIKSAENKKNGCKNSVIPSLHKNESIFLRDRTLKKVTQEVINFLKPEQFI